jgi:alkylmercury lyase
VSSDYVGATVDLVERLDGFELTPHAIRLLAEGEPVALERLGATSGHAVEDVEAALRGVGGVEWDEHGRLVGLALTLRPTAHRYTTEGRTLYSWCADDTLMIPVVLGRGGMVDSTCPETGRAIHVEVSPERVQRVEPAGAVVTSVRPNTPIANVRTATCNHGHFFASAAAASNWAAEHPGGHVHSVDEAFRLDKEVLERVGWAAT